MWRGTASEMSSTSAQSSGFVRVISRKEDVRGKRFGTGLRESDSDWGRSVRTEGGVLSRVQRTTN